MYGRYSGAGLAVRVLMLTVVMVSVFYGVDAATTKECFAAHVDCRSDGTNCGPCLDVCENCPTASCKENRKLCASLVKRGIEKGSLTTIQQCVDEFQKCDLTKQRECQGCIDKCSRCQPGEEGLCARYVYPCGN